jgi:hypothetical protein
MPPASATNNAAMMVQQRLRYGDIISSRVPAIV